MQKCDIGHLTFRDTAKMAREKPNVPAALSLSFLTINQQLHLLNYSNTA
jgi:hypothetical protein